MSVRPPGLVDVLDRILDKGLVVAGDIKISLANVELLTLQIRLLVCSIDKAEQIGLNWWKYDRNLSLGKANEIEHNELRQRVEELEREIKVIAGGKKPSAQPASAAARTGRSRSKAAR